VWPFKKSPAARCLREGGGPQGRRLVVSQASVSTFLLLLAATNCTHSEHVDVCFYAFAIGCRLRRRRLRSFARLFMSGHLLPARVLHCSS